jgi:hypothetical protein
MSWPVTLPDSWKGPGLREQGLTVCEACTAINLPASNYCCACGIPLPGGELDTATRTDIEQLVRDARLVAPSGPIWAEEGQAFHSRALAGTLSYWPAALASPQFISDVWAGLANFQHARVLLVERLEGPITTLYPLIESAMTQQQILVIVTGKITGEMLTMLVVNHLQGRFRCMALVLTLPAASHPVLLSDIAAMLRTKVVLAKALPKTKVDVLPVAPSILADERSAWAVGLTQLPVPALEGDPAVVAARRAIYERTGVRIEMGANSRSGIECRRRYACRVLRQEPQPATTPTGVTAAPSEDVRRNE